MTRSDTNSFANARMSPVFGSMAQRSSRAGPTAFLAADSKASSTALTRTSLLMPFSRSQYSKIAKNSAFIDTYIVPSWGTKKSAESKSPTSARWRTSNIPLGCKDYVSVIKPSRENPAGGAGRHLICVAATTLWDWRRTFRSFCQSERTSIESEFDRWAGFPELGEPDVRHINRTGGGSFQDSSCLSAARCYSPFTICEIPPAAVDFYFAQTL